MEHYIQVIFVLALAKYCLKAAMTGRLWVMAAYAAVAAVVALVLYPAVITRPVTIVAGLLADRRLVTDGAVLTTLEATPRSTCSTTISSLAPSAVGASSC